MSVAIVGASLPADESPEVPPAPDPEPDAEPDSADKAVIYLEVPPVIKELMEGLAREHNRRLTGECIQALQEYLARHELWPPAKGT